MKLGRLKKVELRKIWKHEAYDFSSWLAKPENLATLSEEIGITLVNPETESGVGSFSADIVAEEEGSNRKVLIENQLEASNHDHLGKLITYGAGLDTEVIIWIVKMAREEHEQAVNWLNEHTDEKVNLFIIQMEAWQIGESEVAPKFNIIAKPNDWAKTIKQSSGKRAITEYKLLQQRFWEALRESAGEQSIFGSKKPRPQHWYDVAIGGSNGHISLTLNSFENTIGCELYISRDSDKLIFDKLYKNRDAIESELGLKLDWMRLDDKIASRIKASVKGNVESEEKWPGYFLWLTQTSTKFKKVFLRYLK